MTEPVRELGQMPLVAHPMQKPLRAERRRGEYDLVRGQRPGHRVTSKGPTRQLRLGVADPHLVAAGLERTHPGDGGERVHDGTVLLREVQVVLGQRVLRVVPATGHALAASQACVALWTRATEVRVGCLVAWLLTRATEEDPDRRRME